MSISAQTNNRIRVMLVEDHHVLRGGLRMLINTQTDMIVVAESGDGLSALNLLQEGLEADVLISDINMPKMDGFALFEQLLVSHKNLKTIAFSMLNSEKQIERALKLGCYGYLTKSIESEELLFGIRQVAIGKKYLCSDVIDAIINSLNTTDEKIDSEDLPEFAERDLLILEKIAQGMTTTQIADQIYLSKRTVEGHRQSLLDKTGSKNTAVLIKYAVIHKLVR
jgi:DNA-binding NarL/FixJ family response regulator